MIRTPLLTATAVALGLLAPLAATSPTSAAPQAGPRAGETVTRFVEYGDRAVVVPKNRRGVVRFTGKKGDVVSLGGIQAERTRLFRGGRRLASQWDDSGLFRLPRTGTYAFHVGVQRYSDQKVQLLKGRVHRLTVDGPAVRTPKPRRGYIDLGASAITAGARITIDTGRSEQRLYRAGGTYCAFPGGPIVLRTGSPVRVADDAQTVDCGEVRAGKLLVRLRSGHRVTAASALVVAAQPDGAPVTLTAPLRAQREVVLTFPAAADDYVYLEGQGGDAILDSTSRLDPWGQPVESLVTGGGDPLETGFVVATGGPTELSTVTSAVGGDATATVRLRKGIRVAGLVPDGPALDIALDGSGTRLYSLATGDGIRLTATPTDLGAGEAWSVAASPRAPYSCGADPTGPKGCADNGYAAVSPARLSATSFFLLRAPVAVAMPAAGTTGTVSLRLLTTP